MSELYDHVIDCINCSVDLCKLSVIVQSINPDIPFTENRCLITIFISVLNNEEYDDWWVDVWGPELDMYKTLKEMGTNVFRDDLDEKLTKDSDGSQSE
jgi:hypothetical protein